MRRWIALVLVVLVSLSGCAQQANGIPVPRGVLIDPGHGGMDGGAVAPDGTLEKHLNLEISLMLRDMLFVCGVPVFITRDTDCALGDGDGTIRQQKVQDLKARLELYNRFDYVISIHQNQFAQSKYSGTQVFYTPNHEQGPLLADAIQTSVASSLQPNNHRESKKATDGIYLLYHTKVPAVLVECGFLSNADELAKLKTASYRQEMAWAIMLGYWNYLSMK